MCVCLNLCYFLTFQTFPDILDTPSSCRGRESWKQNVPIPRVLASINSTRYRPSRSGVPCSRHPVGSAYIQCLKYSFLQGCAFLCLHRLENMGKRCKEAIRATNSTTLCVSIYLNRLCTWDWNCVSIRTQEYSRNVAFENG